MSDEVQLEGLEDEATLTFNVWQQTTELKAYNRRTGKGSIRVYVESIHDPSAMLKENWSLIEDMNFNLASWGWKPLTRADWHGLRDWAAKLTPAD